MQQRPRRLRYNKTLRSMVCETTLEPKNLIYPLFIKEGISEKMPILSMPGQFQLTLQDAVNEVGDCWQKGLKAFLLFGIPKHKDPQASQAFNKNGIVPKTIDAIKQKHPEALIITDVCLCEYTDHGHCGLVDERGNILNDPSLEILSQEALSHVQAGADMVAPSDMMDGRVGSIRKILNEGNFQHIPIMSYAVKYASSFYGPFREAAESSPKFGDRKTYQMDYANVQEALKEAKLDEEEGADILMIKPALPYLDVITKIKERTHLPIAAYQVSGEYSMICAAAQNGWLDREKIILESLMAIKRAGAQLIVSYFAKEIVNTIILE